MILLGARKRSEEWLTTNVYSRRTLYSKFGSCLALRPFLGVGSDGIRKPGQGGDADTQQRDLRTELLAAEAANQAKKTGVEGGDSSKAGAYTASKRSLHLEEGPIDEDEEEAARKRRRILEESREIDADSDGADGDGSSREESDEGSEEEEDETAELMRELEKIKRERAEEREKEVVIVSTFNLGRDEKLTAGYRRLPKLPETNKSEKR